MTKFVPVPRRRRMGLTNYRARKKEVASRGILLTVRLADKNVSAQFIKPNVTGDSVISAVHSRALRKLGWKGSLKNTPACYLLGLLAGKKAAEKGVKEAFLYTGVLPFVKGSRLAAFVKGVSDAGLKVPISESAFPSEKRLKGESISTYASSLLKENKEEYTRRFSALLKLGLKPEDYPAHYEKVRASIVGGR